MYKREVTYQLDNLDVITITEDSLIVGRKGKKLLELNREQLRKVVEEYREINE